MEPNTLKYFNYAERLKSFANKWNFDKISDAKCTSKEVGFFYNFKNFFILAGYGWLCIHRTGVCAMLCLSARNALGVSRRTIVR